MALTKRSNAKKPKGKSTVKEKLERKMKKEPLNETKAEKESKRKEEKKKLGKKFHVWRMSQVQREVNKR